MNSPFHCTARPRPRQRSIPLSPTPDPLAKVNRGLGRPADHVLYPGIESLLNPEEKREELRIAEEKEKRLIRSEMERAQAAHLRFKQHIQLEYQKLSAFSLTKADLERAVKAARIKAKFDKIRAWRLRIQTTMETRLAKLRFKSVHALKEIDSSVELVDSGLRQWHQSVAKYRRELVGVGQRLEVTMTTLRAGTSEESGEDLFSRGRKAFGIAAESFGELVECTSVSGLVQLASELAPYCASSATDLSRQERSWKFLAALENKDLRKILIDLAFWNIGSLSVYSDIGLQMHYYRRLRSKGIMYKAMPEVFAHDYKQLFVVHLFRLYSTNSTDIDSYIRRLRNVIAFCRSGSLRYDGYLLKIQPMLTSFEAQQALVEIRSVLEPLAILDEGGDLPLQHALFLDLRPFYDSLVQLHPIREDLQKLGDFSMELAETETPRNQNLIARAWAMALHQAKVTQIIRDTQHALEMVRIWRAIANVALGIHKTPTRHHWLPIEKPHHPELSLKLKLEKLPLLPDSATSAEVVPAGSWLPLSPSLYPLDGVVPIHYVTTPRSLQLVSQLLARSSVLGIDLVLSSPPKTGWLAMKSRINFLLIASEHHVAIVDMDCMPPSLSPVLYPILQQTLGNPRIVKVGVHTELQRRILWTDNGIELVNAVDLAPGHLPPRTNNEPTFTTLSTMVDANLGSPLPKMLSKKAILAAAGTKDPILYFGCKFPHTWAQKASSDFSALDLASRPYAALQLLKKADPYGSQQLMTRLPGAGLGPVIVHPLPNDSPCPARQLKMSPPLQWKRDEYLEVLVQKLCSLMINKNAYLRTRQVSFNEGWRRYILQGYIRLTTFGQSLHEVHYFLNAPTLRAKSEKADFPPTFQAMIEKLFPLLHFVTSSKPRSHGLLAFALLSLVRSAGLPLSSEHESMLRTACERFNRGEGSELDTQGIRLIDTPAVQKGRKVASNIKLPVDCPSVVTPSSGRSGSIVSPSIPVTRHKPGPLSMRPVELRNPQEGKKPQTKKATEVNANNSDSTSRHTQESRNIISSRTRSPHPLRRDAKVAKKARKDEKITGEGTGEGTGTRPKLDSASSSESVNISSSGRRVRSGTSHVPACEGRSRAVKDQQPTDTVPADEGKVKVKLEDESPPKPKLQTIEKETRWSQQQQQQQQQRQEIPISRVPSTPRIARVPIAKAARLPPRLPARSSSRRSKVPSPRGPGFRRVTLIHRK